MPSILALDLGSTQLKILLMNEQKQVVYIGTEGYETHTPCAYQMQQRPQDWESALLHGIQTMHEKGYGIDIDAISFSGHMSGIVLVNCQGEPLYPCIMLSDNRSTAQCKSLNEKIGQRIRKETGNAVINAFSLPKLLWIKENEPEIWQKTKTFLSPKDYLRFLITGEMSTECTDAYNTLCVSSKTRTWSEEIIEATGLEREKFPHLYEPQEQTGTVSAEASRKYGLKQGIPVYAGAADMACGAIGMGLFEKGESALTLGTCATFLALVDGMDDRHFGEVTFHLHAIPGLMYALGSHVNGGLAVNWATRVLSASENLDYSEIARLSEAAERLEPGCGGLLTLPFLAGSGSPYFSTMDRQTVLGISTATTKAALFRSELEGITLNLLQTKKTFDGMTPGGVSRLLLGGGGSKIGIWPQMISDVFHTTIEVAANADASSVGAAILGGIGAGIFSNACLAARQALTICRQIEPDENNSDKYCMLYDRYLRVYNVLHAVYANLL